MNTVFQTICIAFFLASCSPNSTRLKYFESEDLKIEQVTEHLYQHISYLDVKKIGKFPCNGLVYICGNKAIVFDTPTTKKASKTLLRWIGSKKVIAVVTTHFHIDALGSLNAFHAKSIPSFATQKTIDLAKQNGSVALPKNAFENSQVFKLEDKKAWAVYFGEGHTKDNSVGYIPSEKALFGGCLIKPVEGSKGNLADANILDWSTTVEKIQRQYPEVIHVIPGHGKRGGAELLAYTIQLFKEEK